MDLNDDRTFNRLAVGLGCIWVFWFAFIVAVISLCVNKWVL